jgi:hypothetical protein
MPACPPGGCTCAWLWVPHGCGIPNMYMQGFKCNVTGATSTAPVAPAKAPIYCDTDSSNCVAGAKQMIAWNQATGNNVSPPNGISPGYNSGMGWAPGAQNDIFVSASGSSTTPISSSTSSLSVSTQVASVSSSSTSIKAISTGGGMSTSVPSATAVSRPISISTTSSQIITATIPPSSTAAPTTLITSKITSALLTSQSITPFTTSSAFSATSTSAAPVGTSTMFPDFVKWMEAAWAEWVASQGGES